jgi:hypothetical protein
MDLPIVFTASLMEQSDCCLFSDRSYLMSSFFSASPTPNLLAMARPFLQIKVTIPEGLLHGEWSGPLDAQRCLPLLLLHDRRLWWLFILLLHRNLRHAIGKVPIGSGGERHHILCVHFCTEGVSLSLGDLSLHTLRRTRVRNRLKCVVSRSDICTRSVKMSVLNASRTSV